MSGIELVAELKGHTEPAWCVAWNPTRPLLASCSTDKSVRLYTYHFPSSSSSSTDDARPVFTFLTEIPTAHKRTIRSIAWSPSGRTLVTGSFDSTVGIWEQLDERDEGIEPSGGISANDEREDGTGEWECVTTLEGHESECKSVGYSSDGALLASCSRDKSVWVWEVQPDSDFECISVMMEHTQDVKTLAWHPKEEILASASYDASILLFADDPDADWGPFQKLQPSLPAVDPAVAPGLKSQDEQMSLAGDETKLSSADDNEKNDEFTVPALKDPETIWSLAFSPCGMFLASGGDNGGVRIWARGGHSTEARWTEVAHYRAHDPRACFSLSWTDSPSTSESERDEDDLGRLASTGGDGRILIWHVRKTSETILSSHLSSPVPKITATIVGLQERAHEIHDINSVAWCRRSVPEEEDAGSPGYARAVKMQQRTRRLLATAADDGSVKPPTMHPRKSMATSAPTYVGGHQIGASASSSATPSITGAAAGADQPANHSPAGEDNEHGGAERSFFEQERDRLVEEIAGGFEDLLSSANVLNRKLEEVFGVGKEFQTVANLWGQFNELIREQKDDASAVDSAIPHPHHGPSLATSGSAGGNAQHPLRASQGVPGTGGATFGQPL